MTQESATPKPIPEPDEASARFFEGTLAGKLMLMRCRNCRAWRLPSRPRCPECWSTDTEWAQASGRARLYSWGLMHQKFPGFEDETPYQYAIVELEEGPRIVSNIVGVADTELRADLPLIADFDDVSPDTTLVRFKPRPS